MSRLLTPRVRKIRVGVERKFEEYATDAGRDPEEIDRSWLAHVLICEDQEELEEYVDRIFPLPLAEESDIDERLEDTEDAREKGSMLIGTPAEVEGCQG